MKVGHLPTVQELAAEARATNAANGWGENFRFVDVPNYLALIHSEVTEAATASSRGHTVRELGDVIVRALDLAELLSPGSLGGLPPLGPTLEDSDWPPHEIDPRRLPLVSSLLQLHTLTSGALESFRKVSDEMVATLVIVGGLRDVVAYACACMKTLQDTVDPSAVVLAIIEANKERGYRHGGRRS